MPAEAEHLQQARHNEALAKLLAQDMTYRDWIITTSFYAALHYVEANFAKRLGFHGEIHGGDIPHVWRLKVLDDRTKFSFDCFRAYKKLYAASRHARYLMENTLPNGASFDDRAIERLLDDLATVKKELKYK
jgi:hypothetical protein